MPRICTLTILFFPFLVAAQLDSHYWTSQFGGKGLLLNGAVIASSQDENAIFYNPASLGKGSDFGVSLSFLAPVFSENKVSNFLQEDSDFSDNSFGLAPGFAAVSFPLTKNRKVKSALASFTRFQSNIDYKDREVTNNPDNPDILNVGKIDFTKQLAERWFGFGASYEINNNFSLGGSQFIIVRRESTALTLHRNFVTKSNPNNLYRSYRFSEQYKISSSVGFITKIGLTWQASNRDLILGLTATTPSYGYLSKKGAYNYDIFAKVSKDSVLTLSNHLEGIPIHFKSHPLALGIGLDYKVGHWRFSMSSEYYHSIAKYSIAKISTDPYLGLSSSQVSHELNLVNSASSVTNFAVGITCDLRSDLSILVGGRSDFDPQRRTEAITTFEVLNSIPSVFHISAGSLIHSNGKQISIGLDYGFGKKFEVQNVFDFENVNSSDIEFVRRPLNSKYRSFLLILTYDFIFDKFRNQRSEGVN